MPTLQATSTIPASRREVFAWHQRPGAFGRLAPPWQRTRVVEAAGGIAPGGRLLFESRRGPLRVSWDARHTDFEQDRLFTDVQVRGPFRAWTHAHRFADGPAPGSCVLEDAVAYVPPLGRVGGLLAGRALRRELERLFAYRHARTRFDLSRHAEWSRARGSDAPLRVAVSGASGLIGAALCDVLTTGGHAVTRLVRRKPAGGDEALFAPGVGPRGGQIDAGPLEGLDAVVHLAGEPIMRGRLNAARAATIRDSRVEGTRLLATTLATLQKPPPVLIVASGVGLYGDRGDQELLEDAGVGSGFLAELARDWEGAADPARQAGLRVVHLRLGMVLAGAGGVLAALRPIFSLGLGAVPGHGGQWWPWASLDDVIWVTCRAISDPALAGPLNVVSPGPVTAAEFCRALARVLDRSLLMKAPAWAMRAAAGPRAEWFMASARAMPAALRRAGFQFAHPTLEAALRWELGLVTAEEAKVTMTWSG